MRLGLVTSRSCCKPHTHAQKPSRRQAYHSNYRAKGLSPSPEGPVFCFRSRIHNDYFDRIGTTSQRLLNFRPSSFIEELEIYWARTDTISVVSTWAQRKNHDVGNMWADPRLNKIGFGEAIIWYLHLEKATAWWPQPPAERFFRAYLKSKKHVAWRQYSIQLWLGLHMNNSLLAEY